MQDHFQGKSVVEHLKEAKAKGMSASHEVHGAEMPGHLCAGADAARECALYLVLLWILSYAVDLSPKHLFVLLLLFCFGLMLWKGGRSAWLGYMRMQRLHRLIEEERWEIQHHRQQERDELREIYRAKGFEGKLLEEVLDVLMADDNRLLKVMLEEELGLTLEAYEHPLKQCTGALIGVCVTTGLCFVGLWIWPAWGLPLAATLIMGSTSFLFAHLEKNPILPALIWNLSLAALVAAAVYFLELGLCG